MRVRAAVVTLVMAASAALSACGSSADDPRLQLITPPEYVGALPVHTPEAAREHQITKHEAAQLRPLLAGWAKALSRGDADDATNYFALPAIVSTPSLGGAVEVSETAVMRVFNDRLPCGARLGAVRPQGRYLVATFVLTERPGHTCDAPGELVKVGFVFDGRRFSEFWQEADRTSAKSPGPEHRPAGAAPATKQTFGG